MIEHDKRIIDLNPNHISEKWLYSHYNITALIKQISLYLIHDKYLVEKKMFIIYTYIVLDRDILPPKYN